MTTIAHITAPAPFGGLERVVATLSRESVARGHRVVLVATLSPGAPVPAWAAALAAEGVTVEPLHLSSRAYLAERRAVRALLVRHGVQVAHTHGYRSDVMQAGVVRGLGLPLVSTAHGFASAGSWRGEFYEWMQRRAWRGFDAVVAVSQPLVAALRAAGVSSSCVTLIRNGITRGAPPPLPREVARQRLGLDVAAPVVGWVGRMSAEKDPVLAVEALASTPPDVRLCMIGAGPLLEACRARAVELGVTDRVTFAGAVPDAAPLLSAFDALLISSRTEGTPMVVLEAAAAGVPVVSTAVGGMPDLLADEAGWLVPPQDAAALAGAISACLADSEIRTARATTLRARLSAGADGKDWVDRYLELYERLRRG